MQNRRRYPRINVRTPVIYECYDDDGEIFEQRMGVALNVSQGGMLIESDRIIDANYIKIVFVSYDNEVLSIVGSVVYSRKTKNGKTKTGLCFHGNNSESLKFVTNLIRAYYYRKRFLNR